MAPQSPRSAPLLRWQQFLVFLALGSCNAHELQVPKPNPQQETDFWSASPVRAVDILFMIDNSLSMDPKQAALAANFPKMIEALEKLPDGLPDVRIGVISSTMGAGWGEAGGNCDVPLGNQGILWGNDANVDPGEQRNKYATVKHLKNDANADGCGMNVGTRWIEDVRTGDGVTRQKNYQGKLTDVFSCLAKAVGVSGCGYEHPLQSIRLALNPMQDVNKAQNAGFLRPNAYLAVVLITDEDDCSADPDSKTNGRMFFPRLPSEAAGLRCAARGHVCNGKSIPDYDPNVGYTRGSPFEANLSDCEAKDIERRPPKDPNDTDPTYAELPLIRIREIIDSVNHAKANPQDQILVSGIIGWPQDADLASAKYRIDKDPTSVDQEKLWDYMPVCSVPSQKSADGNVYKAYAGFRLKKFIDAFAKPGERGIFSICSIDNFQEAMNKIGNAIASRLTPGCVKYPLIDTNPDLDEVQPECQVKDRAACDTPGDGEGCLSDGYREALVPQCINPDTGHPLDPQSPEKAKVPDAARPCWYLGYDHDEATGCPRAFKHQRISALRKKDGFAPPGTLLEMQCLTCASPPNGDESTCPALGTM